MLVAGMIHTWRCRKKDWEREKVLIKNGAKKGTRAEVETEMNCLKPV